VTKLCLPKAIFGEFECDGRCGECVVRRLAEKWVLIGATIASLAMLAARFESMANCVNELCEAIEGGEK